MTLNVPSDTQLVYTTFYAEINENTVRAVIDSMRHIVARGSVQEVHMAMSSVGGDPSAGIVLYNFLRVVPFNLTIHNLGNVDSAAIVIYLAGHYRTCAPQSRFLFHGCTTRLNGDYRPEMLEEKRQFLLAGHHNMAQIIAGRSHIALDEATNLFEGETIFDPALALQRGITHEVEIFQWPQGALIIPMGLT